jgi:hypothetical protein
MTILKLQDVVFLIIYTYVAFIMPAVRITAVHQGEPNMTEMREAELYMSLTVP